MVRNLLKNEAEIIWIKLYEQLKRKWIISDPNQISLYLFLVISSDITAEEFNLLLRSWYCSREILIFIPPVMMCLFKIVYDNLCFLEKDTHGNILKKLLQVFIFLPS